MGIIREYIKRNMVSIDGEKYNLNDYPFKILSSVKKELINSLDKVIKQIEELNIKDAEVAEIKDMLNEALNTIKTESNPINIKDYGEFSVQYKALYWRLHYQFYDMLRDIGVRDDSSFTDDLKAENLSIKTALKKLSNLNKFNAVFKYFDNGVVIIGQNGSGKSSFVSFFKDIFRNEMVLMPSQKLLFFNSQMYSLYEKNIEDVRANQNKNHIENFKQGAINAVFEEFSTVVMALGKRQIEDLIAYKNNELVETVLDKFNAIWSQVIPLINFDFNSTSLTFKPKSENGQEYELNELSDGEKAIFYYIANILLARENSYIIVDEPENNLNFSVYNKLWNILESARPDCKFSYVSHSVDFVQSRGKLDLLWMKKYIPPSDWEYEEITKDKKIPMELILKIYGTTDIILFCEGKKDSLDFRVYEALFGEKYLVVPVDGCDEVKKNTRLVNKLTSSIHRKAIGLIDNDNRHGEEINKLKKDKIYVTKYNEIEMLLCSEVIMTRIISAFEPDESVVEKRADNFRTNIIDKVRDKKNKIAMRTLTNIYNSYLSTYKIDEPKSIELFLDETGKINNEFNHNELFSEILSQINESLESKSFNEVLRICNLKREVSRELANVDIDNNYETKAVGIIKKYPDVREILIDTYFADLEKED